MDINYEGKFPDGAYYKIELRFKDTEFCETVGKAMQNKIAEPLVMRHLASMLGGLEVLTIKEDRKT